MEKDAFRRPKEKGNSYEYYIGPKKRHITGRAQEYQEIKKNMIFNTWIDWPTECNSFTSYS